MLSPLGTRVFGCGVLQKLLLFSVLTSASASTQTTILPTARTTISMASWGALPKAFARVHPRFQTPSFSTLAMGGVSIVWTVGAAVLTSSPGNVLGDSITGLGFAILFYYGFTGLACAIYFRRELFKSWHRALLVGLVPFAGFGGMAYIFVKSLHHGEHAGLQLLAADARHPAADRDRHRRAAARPRLHGRAVDLHARVLQAAAADRRPGDPRRAPRSRRSVIAAVALADLDELVPLMRGYCDFYEVAPSDGALRALALTLLEHPDTAGVQLIARDDGDAAIGFATLFWTYSTLAASRSA